MRETGGFDRPWSAAWSMRRVAARALLGVAVLVLQGLIATDPARSTGLTAELTATADNGHGRLVFTFSDVVKADVQISNNILIVAFDKSVSLSTENLRGRLSGYVQAVRRDPDGTALRMSLSRRVKVNTMAAGEMLFVDLLPESWNGLPPGLPQSVIDDLAKRARQAEQRAQATRVAVASEPVVRLQVANAPTFSRFSFEMSVPMEVSSEREGQELRLHFDALAAIELGAARAQLPKGVVGLDTDFGERRSTVKLVLAPNAEVRQFRENRALILDVTPAPVGVLPPAIRDLSEQAEADAARTRSEAEAKALAEAKEKAEAERRTAPLLAAANSPEIAPAPLDLTTHPAGQDGQLAPLVGRQSGRFTVDFAFTDPIGAAAFIRGDNVWLVFDTPRAIDASVITDEQTRIVHEAEFVRTDLGGAVRLQLARARLPSLERDGNVWRLTLADSVAHPTRPLPLRRVPGIDERGTITVPLESGGQVHRLNDPTIGDTVYVVTAQPPARGVLREQRFVEFRALASIHGLAFVPLADDLAVTLSADGAQIARPAGLAVSNMPAPPPPPRQVETRPATALDLALWRAEQQTDYAKREGELLLSVSEGAPGQRADARLMLARFYLAHGFEAEALGVLEAGAREDNQLANRPLYHLLRGIGELEIGRSEEAIALFNHAKVAAVPEAVLLRAIAQADLGRWTEARDAMRVGASAIPDLPAEFQRRLMFAAARAALGVRDINEASRYVHDLEAASVPAEDEAKLALLSARVAEGVGRFERANAVYETIGAVIDGPAAAEARLRSIALRYERRELDRRRAIELLETLAILWRGDWIELDAIRLLGRLYVAESRYRDAFALLDDALIVDPEAEATHKFHAEMGAVFEDLFLTGKAETLPAVDALALYYDFSRLTPIGRRGDELIRRLAERLVAVDLLEQAAELLDHQVNYRLTGAAKVQVAAKLAIVHLMNRKPAEAVRVLAATRMPQLPQDVREQRLFIEARALSETGRHDVALELMQGLRGPEADRLRADIYWAAKKWREAGERLEKLVGERWKDEAPLDAGARHDVLRAAMAYVLGGEAIGLGRLKQKFADKMGETPEGKVMALLLTPAGTSAKTMTEAAKALASFDSLGTFVREHRARYPDRPFAADPTPTSALTRASAR
jgi:hypothetical protein